MSLTNNSVSPIKRANKVDSSIVGGADLVPIHVDEADDASDHAVRVDVLTGAMGRVKREFWAMDSKWGVVADNSTDNAGALNECIEEAQAVGSGFGPATALVHLTPHETLGGIVKVGSQIVVRKGVRLIGPSERQVIIRASSAFPTSTALVRLGDASESDCFGTSVERLALDCNQVTGSIGLYSTSIMEHGGARDILVNGFMAKGIFLETTGCQNAHFEHIECNIGTGAPAGSRAIHLDTTGGRTGFTDVTVNGDGAGTQGDGLVLTGGCFATVFDMHVEHVDYGVRLISGAGSFHAIDGHSSVITVVRYEGGNGMRATGIYKLGATNAIQDVPRSVTITSDNYDYTVGNPDSSNGWYVQGTQVLSARKSAVADVASANATDLASAITLANETKTQLNALLNRLRASTGHGIIA